MMNILKYIAVLTSVTLISACGQIQRVLDGTEGLPNQIAETNKGVNETVRGMKETNESIRQEKMAVALTALKNKDNRVRLSPVPFDMLPFGKGLAEAFTAKEALEFLQLTLKKINEDNFEADYPDADSSTAEGKLLLASFEKEKLADLLMITVVGGYLPDDLVNEMIKQQSEQGAYRDILFQTLMLRTIFYNDLMLNASLMENKLETLGQINLAVEYNSKVEGISRLKFVNRVALKVTGFKDPEMNDSVSRQWDGGLAVSNWKRIYSAAQQDFKATSYSDNAGEQSQTVQDQNNAYAQVLNQLQNYIQSWPVAPSPRANSSAATAAMDKASIVTN